MVRTLRWHGSDVSDSLFIVIIQIEDSIFHLILCTVTIPDYVERTYTNQKSCLELIAVREEVSHKVALSFLDPNYQKKNQLMLSGDISFSYPYSRVNAKYYTSFFSLFVVI